jgi:oligo-1,6-glucosidase
LTELRHTDPVVVEGDFELLLPEHPALWAFLRRSEAGALLVAANFSTERQRERLPVGGEWGSAAAVISNLAPGGGTRPPRVSLAPWECTVWRLPGTPQIVG